jgi:hypothetical protein
MSRGLLLHFGKPDVPDVTAHNPSVDNRANSATQATSFIRAFHLLPAKVAIGIMDE